MHPVEVPPEQKHPVAMHPVEVPPEQKHPVAMHPVEVPPEQKRLVAMHPVEVHPEQKHPVAMRPVEVHPVQTSRGAPHCLVSTTHARIPRAAKRRGQRIRGVPRPAGRLRVANRRGVSRGEPNHREWSAHVRLPSVPNRGVITRAAGAAERTTSSRAKTNANRAEFPEASQDSQNSPYIPSGTGGNDLSQALDDGFQKFASPLRHAVDPFGSRVARNPRC